MSMTKKHFEAIARLITEAGRDVEYIEPKAAVRLLAMGLANYCAEQNSRFDRERFLKACGVLP